MSEIYQLAGPVSCRYTSSFHTSAVCALPRAVHLRALNFQRSGFSPRNGRRAPIVALMVWVASTQVRQHASSTPSRFFQRFFQRAPTRRRRQTARAILKPTDSSPQRVTQLRLRLIISVCFPAYVGAHDWFGNGLDEVPCAGDRCGRRVLEGGDPVHHGEVSLVGLEALGRVGIHGRRLGARKRSEAQPVVPPVLGFG